MRKPLLVSLFLMFCLVSFAGAQTATWEPVIPMDKQIFPSFIMSLAAIHSEEDADGFTDAFVRTSSTKAENGKAVKASDAERYQYMMSSGRIGVVIKNPGKNTKIKYSIQIDKLADLQSYEITTKEGEEQLALMCPALTWNFDALRGIKAPMTVNAKFSISINGGPSETKNVVVRVRTLNDAVFAYSYPNLDKTTAWKDNSYIFGAYVDEDNPQIDKILKEALDAKIVTSFTGYQTKNKNEILKQVFAIWNFLQKRGVKYSSITDSSAYGKREYSQHVRMFDEALATSQANCVDGSVVFVSILRKIGIDANLILIPGHCFVVFYNGVDGTVGLETTMIGNVDLKDVAADPELVKSLGPDAALQVSLRSFLAAVESGNKTYGENIDKIQAQKDPRYVRVDIGLARRQHWLPITR